MEAGLLGAIFTPNQGNKMLETSWSADNGCFSRKGFDIDKWHTWLIKKSVHADTCLFATAPDVVGDAQATLDASLPWLPVIRELGFPAAFVAQDGLENLETPWDEFDVLFIGGSTDWKLGPHAAALIHEAKSRGKWVHMGRVNSRKRFEYAKSLGCDSADGTFITFGPSVNLPKVLTWNTPKPPRTQQLTLFSDTE